MNAYDMLAEIGVGSVQREARRRVLGHESLAARHPTAKECRREPTGRAMGTWRPTRQRNTLRPLASVIVATRVAFGAALVRVGWRIRGATGDPDGALGASGPVGNFGTSDRDARRGSPPQSSLLVRPPR